MYSKELFSVMTYDDYVKILVSIQKCTNVADYSFSRMEPLEIAILTLIL